MSGTNYIASNWRIPENSNSSKNDNYSLRFDGTSREHIALGSNSFFLPGKPTTTTTVNNPKFSVSVWFNFDSSIQGVQRYIIGCGQTGGANYWAITKDANDNLSFFVRTSSGGYTTIVDTTTLNSDTWYHGCIVWDGNNLRLFLDNNENAAPVAATTFYYNSTSPNWDSIGSFQYGSISIVNVWEGKISEASVFDYTLSDSQVSDLYGDSTLGSGNPMALKPTPVAYYPLGDNSSGDPVTQPNVSVDDASVFEFIPASTQAIDIWNGVAADAPSAFTIGASESYTISCWVKSNVAASPETILTVRKNVSGSVYNKFMLTYNSGTDSYRARIDLRDDDNTTALEVSNATNLVVRNQWNHVAAVIDRTATKLYVYVNGVVTGTGTDISGIGAFTDITDVAIGYDTFSGGRYYFDGEMSNLAVFKQALDQTQIDSIYNDGMPSDISSLNPAAWYKLDQSANWEADTSGNWQIPDAVSVYPQSFSFVRTSSVAYSRIFVHDGPFSYPTGKVSASIWFKWNGFKAFQTMIADDYSSGDDRIWWLGVDTNSNGKARFVVLDTAGNYNYIQSSTNLQAEKWYHIAVTYDGTTNADAMKLYLNNQLDSQGTTIAGGLQVPTSVPADYKVQIGHQSKSSSQVSPWGSSATPGELSNACIWDTNLDDTQIEALYNNGTPLITAIQSANLKGWWKLDDTETYLKPDASQTENLYEAWLVKNQKYPASVDNCLLFANQNYIRYDNFDLINEAELTVSFWYLHDQSTNTNDKVLGSWDTDAYNFIINVNRSGVATVSGILRTNDGAGGFVANSFSFGNISTPTVGWRLLTLTYNGSVIKAYVNDEEVDSLSATGTVYDLNPYVGGPRNYNQSIRDGLGSANGMRMSNIIYWNKALTPSELTTLYNNGTPLLTKESIPQDSSMLLWNTLENKTETISGGLYDKSGNSVSIQNIVNPSTIIVDNVPVSAKSGISSGMTEQSLVNNNVSTLNGESSGMTSGNLVLSDLTRNLPYENYSLNFDSGSSEDIDLGSISTLNNASTYTLSMWVNPSVLSGLQFLFAIVTSTTERLFINLNNAIPNVGMANGTNSAESFNSAPLTVDTWHHLSVVFDGTQTGADRLTFYLNGVAETTTVTTWDSSTPTFASNGFLAKYGQIALYYFSGKISNFSIFNNALTSTEILKLYANGLPQDLTSFTPQPSHWWTLGKESFWNGSDWIVRDMIGSNDGTSSNMAVGDLVGNAPRSEANGTATNMDIPTNLVGNAGFSDKNAYSINMSPSARVTDTP